VATNDPTWTEVGAIAEAIVALTKHADLSHDLLIELALPAIRRLAAMGERLSTDPHGDSDPCCAEGTTTEPVSALFPTTHVVTIPIAGGIHIAVAADNDDDAIAAAWDRINSAGFDPAKDGELEYDYLTMLSQGNVSYAQYNEIEVREERG